MKLPGDACRVRTTAGLNIGGVGLLLATMVIASLSALSCTGAGSSERITEVTLERFTPYCPSVVPPEKCPHYKLIYEEFEKATYIGYKGVPMIGTYKGQIENGDFLRLVDLVNAIGYFDLKNYYGPCIDGPLVFTSAVRGGQQCSIETGCDDEDIPVDLWALEMTMDAMAAKIDWQPE